jgi:hypothetical protein
VPFLFLSEFWTYGDYRLFSTRLKMKDERNKKKEKRKNKNTIKRDPELNSG